jgi:hypothetical protein
LHGAICGGRLIYRKPTVSRTILTVSSLQISVSNQRRDLSLCVAYPPSLRWNKEKFIKGRLNWLRINLTTFKKDVREKKDVNMNMLSIFLSVEERKIDGKKIGKKITNRRWPKVVL